MATLDTQTVVVDFLQGKLRGRKQTTTSGRPYFSFQGIPYALPPVGPLRFKVSKPTLPWKGIRDALQEGNVAPQKDFINGLYMGDEDCLYLNVYTPKIPSVEDFALLPAMVWIHGGGFLLGSGNSDFFGPGRLMEYDIVLITINYRLGVLGFLSTGDHVLPGNLGLKDQVLALKWVKSNIENFGGDPNNVTIFGESAGAMSCHLLILSPAAKGLFHRAILQSGAISPEIVAYKGLGERSFRLARFLGFSGETSEELYDYMMELSAEKMVESMHKAFSEEEILRLELFPFVPTIEPEGTVDSFLTKTPKEIMKNGEFCKVPIIIGINSREGIMFLLGLKLTLDALDHPTRPCVTCSCGNNLKDKMCGEKAHTLQQVQTNTAMPTEDALLQEMNEKFYRALPIDLPVDEGEARDKAAKDVKNMYFSDKDLDRSTVPLYGDLRGDLMFAYPSLRAASCLSSLSGAQPVYFYLFDVVTQLNSFKKLMKAEHLQGASHVDEVSYLFTSGNLPNEVLQPGSVEATAVQRMTGMWTNFAKGGIPIPDASDTLFGITWTPFTSENCCYLHIENDGLSIKKNLFKERMDLWDRLYKL